MKRHYLLGSSAMLLTLAAVNAPIADVTAKAIVVLPPADPAPELGPAEPAYTMSHGITGPAPRSWTPKQVREHTARQNQARGAQAYAAYRAAGLVGPRGGMRELVDL